MPADRYSFDHLVLAALVALAGDLRLGEADRGRDPAARGVPVLGRSRRDLDQHDVRVLGALRAATPRPRRSRVPCAFGGVVDDLGRAGERDPGVVGRQRHADLRARRARWRGLARVALDEEPEVAVELDLLLGHRAAHVVAVVVDRGQHRDADVLRQLGDLLAAHRGSRVVGAEPGSCRVGGSAKRPRASGAETPPVVALGALAVAGVAPLRDDPEALRRAPARAARDRRRRRATAARRRPGRRAALERRRGARTRARRCASSPSISSTSRPCTRAASSPFARSARSGRPSASSAQTTPSSTHSLVRMAAGAREQVREPCAGASAVAAAPSSATASGGRPASRARTPSRRRPGCGSRRAPASARTCAPGRADRRPCRRARSASCVPGRRGARDQRPLALQPLAVQDDRELAVARSCSSSYVPWS